MMAGSVAMTGYHLLDTQIPTLTSMGAVLRPGASQSCVLNVSRVIEGCGTNLP
jgi:hypothetical protein